jgi:hypothetical protein
VVRCVVVYGCNDGMACFKPLLAWQLDSGEVVFSERGSVRRSLVLPCGQCIGCRLERSRQWAVRCMHESQMHDFSSFVTLTYEGEDIAASLNYRDFQLFAKRLRRKMGPFRFYMCGEYGERFRRPHFHALLFGMFFDDRQFHSTVGSGFKIYRSGLLESLWPHGFSSIGDVTFESAAYVARYVCKKVTGPLADAHYLTNEGECLTPEFTRMSLKPGIGATWLDKYCSDVFPRDYVTVRGVKSKPPRYYDTLYRLANPLSMEELDFARIERADRVLADCTPERLAVREAVAIARNAFKVRTLE